MRFRFLIKPMQHLFTLKRVHLCIKRQLIGLFLGHLLLLVIIFLRCKFRLVIIILILIDFLGNAHDGMLENALAEQLGKLVECDFAVGDATGVDLVANDVTSFF